jgi:hypothetical protein
LERPMTHSCLLSLFVIARAAESISPFWHPFRASERLSRFRYEA